MFSTKPPQIDVMSATSSGSSLMIGDPPHANSAFAQSFTVT